MKLPYFEFLDQSVRTIRIAYPGTGFAFYLTRCKDKKSFVKDILSKKLNLPGFDPNDPPVACCGRTVDNTLPGLIPEAAEGFLSEVHVFVQQVRAGSKDHNGNEHTEETARRTELRHWRHEIGHAADFVRTAIPTILSVLELDDQNYRVEETPAYVTELLCEAVDMCFEMREDDEPLVFESGFESLFKPTVIA